MERLTYWCPDGKGGGEWRANVRGTEVKGEEVNRLAAYEDTGLEPGEIKDLQVGYRNQYESLTFLLCETDCEISHVKELLSAEKEGRLVVLPCKVGDTVYQIRNKRHARGTGVSPRIVSSVCVWSDGEYAMTHQGMTYCKSRDLGKTWFLTREEAAAALRG